MNRLSLITPSLPLVEGFVGVFILIIILYKYLYAPFPTQPKEVDMKHEELHIRAHNAGTNTRLAMSRFTSKSTVIAKRVALKTADATLAGITVVTSFTSAVAPRRKR